MASKTVSSIEVIETFLAAWKANATKFYLGQIKEYKKQRDAKYPITKANLESTLKYYWGEELKYTPAQVETIMARYEAEEMDTMDMERYQSSIKHSMFSRWKNSRTKAEISIIERTMYEAKYLNEMLTKDVDLKRAVLIKRIEKKAGDILSASNLYLGDSGEINGTVEGTLATVNVQTIYAGGYNIQQLHYRVLVK